MKHEEYYKQVESLALERGYTREQVEMFRVDIMEHWSDGMTVEECVDKEF